MRRNRGIHIVHTTSAATATAGKSAAVGPAPFAAPKVTTAAEPSPSRTTTTRELPTSSSTSQVPSGGLHHPHDEAEAASHAPSGGSSSTSPRRHATGVTQRVSHLASRSSAVVRTRTVLYPPPQAKQKGGEVEGPVGAPLTEKEDLAPTGGATLVPRPPSPLTAPPPPLLDPVGVPPPAVPAPLPPRAPPPSPPPTLSSRLMQHITSPPPPAAAASGSAPYLASTSGTTPAASLTRGTDYFVEALRQIACEVSPSPSFTVNEEEAEAERSRLMAAEAERNRLMAAEAERSRLMAAEAERSRLMAAEAERSRLMAAEAERSRLIAAAEAEAEDERQWTAPTAADAIDEGHEERDADDEDAYTSNDVAVLHSYPTDVRERIAQTTEMMMARLSATIPSALGSSSQLSVSRLMSQQSSSGDDLPGSSQWASQQQLQRVSGVYASSQEDLQQNEYYQRLVTHYMETTTATTTPISNGSGSGGGGRHSDDQSSSLNGDRAPSTPTATGSAASSLYSYGLPRDMMSFYLAARGISSLFPWQHEALTRLSSSGLYRNFVYSLSTSAGKSLVAEVRLLECLAVRRLSAMLVVPFISIAEEKVAALAALAAAFSFAVDGQFGTTGSLPPPGRLDPPHLFVCTIEKANSLLNGMLIESGAGAGSLSALGLGLVVVDELHMLGEGRRGAVLEVLLSKLLLLRSSEGGAPCGSPSHETPTPAPPASTFQIIGMSATIRNLTAIASWLKAEVMISDFRPIELQQYCVINGVCWKDGIPPAQAAGPHGTSKPAVLTDATCPSSSHIVLEGSEMDQLVTLATGVDDGACVLIFCSSRQQCLSTATAIRDRLRLREQETVDSTAAPTAGVPSFAPATLPASASVLRSFDLQDLSTGLAHTFRSLLPFRIAVHHGGLLAEERRWVERAYLRRDVRILCCTTTLAAGVNLPARRVIIRSPYVGRDFLTASSYKQIAGRAGRTGLDTVGEAYLLLPHKRDHTRGAQLLQSPPDACVSRIMDEPTGLQRGLLECVATGVVRTRADVRRWATEGLLCGFSWWFGPSTEPSEKVGKPIEHRKRRRDEDCADDSDGSDAESARGNSRRRSRGKTEDEAGRWWSHVKSNDPSFAAAVEQTLRLQLTAMEVKAKENEGKEPPPGLPEEAAASATTTLTSHGLPTAILQGLADHAVDGLLNVGLLTTSHEQAELGEEVLQVTACGQSAVRSCFSVEEALMVRDEFVRLLRGGLVLCDDLHVVYYLVPLRSVAAQQQRPNWDWGLYRQLLSRLSDDRQYIASLIGLDERYVDLKAMGMGRQVPMAGGGTGHAGAVDERQHKEFVAYRFFLALLLTDVLAEAPLDELEGRYGVTRGQIQELMQSASLFSSSMTSFCKAMGWFTLEAVFSSLVKRLGFGTKPDLLPLLEALRSLTPARARALWNAGFKTPRMLLEVSSAEELVNSVKRAAAASTSSHGGGGSNKAVKYFSAKQAAQLLVEARAHQLATEAEKNGPAPVATYY